MKSYGARQRLTSEKLNYAASCNPPLTLTQEEIDMQTPMPTELPKEGYEWVWNIMSRVWVQQEIDTPHCCRVDSESFWSM
jgi:hypothetical protein